MRQRYRVLSVDVAEAHEAETIYRVQVRPADRTTPTKVHRVSQPADRGQQREAPFAVGAVIELDPRLLDEE
jgi:hypothetical protein